MPHSLAAPPQTLLNASATALLPERPASNSIMKPLLAGVMFGVTVIGRFIGWPLVSTGCPLGLTPTIVLELSRNVTTLFWSVGPPMLLNCHALSEVGENGTQTRSLPNHAESTPLLATQGPPIHQLFSPQSLLPCPM